MGIFNNKLILIIFAISALIFNGCEKDEGSKIGSMTDQEGNVYKTIQIGTQIWMAENLRTTHYRNGDPITGYWNYNRTSDSSEIAIYGRLYTWVTVVDNRNIAPDGWHVPTSEEWSTLVTFLGGVDVAGGKMKEKGITHWINPNTDATNESGFTALPSGGIRAEGLPSFKNGYSFFWSSTSSGYFASSCTLSYSTGHCGISNEEMIFAFSVRLIKD